tara:strand:+ start:758 stop:1132 length:375 start_codon:yes stop_codon:yes gene_type:complete
MLILLGIFIGHFANAEQISFKSHDSSYTVEKTEDYFSYRSAYYSKQVNISKCNKKLIEKDWQKILRSAQKGAKKSTLRSLATVKIASQEKRYFSYLNSSRMYLYRYPKKVHILFRKIYQKCGDI